jgi:type I restriction enzyme S subunit
MTLTEFYNKVNPAVGVAQIVFNHLQKEFPVKKIKEVAETTSGGTPDRGNPEYWYGGKIPWIKSGETNDGLITTFEETITEKALANSSAKLFPKGTLLVAMYGATAGKTGVLDFESTTNQALCAVFPGKLVERDYLFWFFRQRRFGYLQESFGGAQPNISQTIIKDTDIPVPDMEIQRQVVSFLEKCEALGELDANFKFKDAFVEINKFFNYRSAYDDLTKSQSTQLSLLTALRQSILTEAVQGRLTAHWRRDNPAPEHARELLHRIATEKARLIREKKIGKEKPLPPVTAEVPYEVPEGWEWGRFQQIATIASNLVNPRSYPDLPHIAPDNIEKGSGRLLSYRSVKEDNLISSKHLFHKGQILYSKIRPRLSKVVEIDFEGLCSADMYPINSYIDRSYLVKL